jgi:hypothetical protein
MNNIKKFLDKCPNKIDLTSDEQAETLLQLADFILLNHNTLDGLQKLEASLTEKSSDDYIFFRLAVKMALSKFLVRINKKKAHLSIIFAVYKEHNRILKKSDHPAGEDFLIKKIEQLEWLYGSQSLISWKMFVVDDGCPEKSGRIAQKIVEKQGLQEKVEVLFLDNAISESIPPLRKISSTNQSQKGGSIAYGMWYAAKKQPNSKNHIVAFTDADLSTHLGQTMLLINPVLNHSKLASIGSRREENSVVVKKGKRNDRGKLFIYLWKQLIPELKNIIDTQCGFKAFNGSIVNELTSNMLEQKFAFDIELLIKTTKIRKDSIEKIAIARIDSEAESTTSDLQPYLPMLQSIAKMHRTYSSPRAHSESYAIFIESLDDKSFTKLLNNIPQAIIEKEPAEYDDLPPLNIEDFA